MSAVLVIQTAAGGSHGHRILVPTGSRLCESDATRLISSVTCPVTVGSAFIGVSRPTDQVTAYNTRRVGKTTAVVSGIDVRAAPAAVIATALERMCDCVARIPADCFGAGAEGSLIIESTWVDQVLRDVVSLGFVENTQEQDTQHVWPRHADASLQRSRIALALQLMLATVCGIAIGSRLRHSQQISIEEQPATIAPSPSTADSGLSTRVSRDVSQPAAAPNALPLEPSNSHYLHTREVGVVVAALMRANHQAAVALALRSLSPQSIADVLDVVIESGEHHGLEPDLVREVRQVAPAGWGRLEDFEALCKVSTGQSEDDLLFAVWRSAPDLDSALTAASRYLEKGTNHTNKSVIESWRTRCQLEITYDNVKNGDLFELQRKDDLGNLVTLTSWVIAADRSPRIYRLPGGLQALKGLRVVFQPPSPTGVSSVFKAPIGNAEEKSFFDAAAVETGPCRCTFRDGDREVSITLRPLCESWAQFGK